MRRTILKVEAQGVTRVGGLPTFISVCPPPLNLLNLHLILQYLQIVFERQLYREIDVSRASQSRIKWKISINTSTKKSFLDFLMDKMAWKVTSA